MSDPTKWAYHRKNRGRGRWNRPHAYAVIAQYFRTVWDEMSTRKSFFQILKEQSHV